MPGNGEYVLASEAGRIIGVSPQRIRQLADTGQLPAERGPLGIRLFDRAAVLEFAERRARRVADKPSTTLRK